MDDRGVLQGVEDGLPVRKAAARKRAQLAQCARNPRTCRMATLAPKTPRTGGTDSRGVDSIDDEAARSPSIRVEETAPCPAERERGNARGRCSGRSHQGER